MTEHKRFMVDDCGTLINIVTRDTYDYVSEVCDLLNEQHMEIEELKKEVEMLRNGLKAYDEALPLYLDCEGIMHFNSELFEFEMERTDFYKKYPNRIHYK